MLEDVCVGVTLGLDASGREGRAATDLLVRLLARLYPAMTIRDESDEGVGREAAGLAQRVNPRVDLSQDPTIEVHIGSMSGAPRATRTIFAGCGGWTARLSSRDPADLAATATILLAQGWRHV